MGVLELLTAIVGIVSLVFVERSSIAPR